MTALRRFAIFGILLCYNGLKLSSALPDHFENDGHCFCQLDGTTIDDCDCNVESVDFFNNQKVFPLLQSLLEKSYFKYFQYNPHKTCPFWSTANGVCKSGGCGIKPCTDEQAQNSIKASAECGPINPDDQIDEAVNADHLKSIQEEFFCGLDTETGPDCEVVDLSINPESYTGFSDENAWRVWHSIYNENCFKTGEKYDKDTVKDMCSEERAFFRTVSGLHTSITIHLTSRYPLSKLNGKPAVPSLFPNIKEDRYGPNLDEFLKRFDPKRTNNQGPFWLRNVYFVYLLELRAIAKATPAILKLNFKFTNDEEDRETAELVKSFLDMVRAFPNHFDENKLFLDNPNKVEVKSEFREHFYNITRIMDCVTCDKCKLWGKLQMTGLATALKILFADQTEVDVAMSEMPGIGLPQLSRHEVVALFNAFGRISTSIRQLEVFREMLNEQKKDEL